MEQERSTDTAKCAAVCTDIGHSKEVKKSSRLAHKIESRELIGNWDAFVSALHVHMGFSLKSPEYRDRFLVTMIWSF